MTENDTAPKPPPAPSELPGKETGLIAWFAYNHVAANLLMVSIILAGLISAFYFINASFLPKINSNKISVNVPYLGATAEEVEQGVILRVEEAIRNIEGIDRFVSIAKDGMGTVNIFTEQDYDVLEVMDEVKTKVDGISTFPRETERPIVEYDNLSFSQTALQFQVYGDLGEAEMKKLARDIKDDLIAIDGITTVEIFGDREFEISIEVPEANLQKYQLSLGRVADLIRRASINLPGGAIRTENGKILVQARGQAYWQQDFENLLLLSYPDGSQLRLKDIATVRDGFTDSDSYARFNGRPSIGIVIFALENQNVLDVASLAKEYLKKRQPLMPEGTYLDSWSDFTFYLQGRLSLMIKNLLLGALLVFVLLTMFMHPKLAFWVVVSIPICFLGALAMMAMGDFNLTINQLSLFAFILVLGIVVDDAIIIGESAHNQISKEGHSIESVQPAAAELRRQGLSAVSAIMP